jgi:hypothetical protein
VSLVEPAKVRKRYAAASPSLEEKVRISVQRHAWTRTVLVAAYGLINFADAADDQETSASSKLTPRISSGSCAGSAVRSLAE